MNYHEALHILSLNDGVTEQEIKAAYRELALIMHPDRFQGNAQLIKRATEQFKLINQAKDTLLGMCVDGRLVNPATKQGRSVDVSHQSAAGYDPVSQLMVRFNALTTARIMLLSYKDAEQDRRKTNLILVLVSLCFALAGRKFALFALVSSALLIYGIIGVVSSHMQLREISEQLDDITQERDSLKAQIDRLR